MKMIYVIRHGQTDWNLKEIIQGNQDINLNNHGKSQAIELKRKLEGIKFDYIISSPLNRAVETAKIATDNKIDIRIDSRLRERGYGELEGNSQYCLKDFNCSADELWNYNLNYSKYGVEPINNFIERVYNVLEDIKKEKFNTILISTHAVVSVAIKYYFEGKNNAQYFMIRDAMKNCECRKYIVGG